MTTSDDMPRAKDVIDWIRVFDELTKRFMKKSSKKQNYIEELKELYQSISDLYLEYTNLFDAFSRQLPYWSERDGQYYGKIGILSVIETSELVKSAKANFFEDREKLSPDRGLWKDVAAGWFRVTENGYERAFLFSVFWFLEYRDDFQHWRTLSNEYIMEEIKGALEHGGSRQFATPSSNLALRISRVDDPEKLHKAINETRLHLSSMFRMVVSNYREMEKNCF